IVSQVLFGRSLPVIQCTGASKCVPVCSPRCSTFQYHAGPFESKQEITSIVRPGELPNCGGRPMTGVSGPSGDVRSTTLSEPALSASTSCVRSVMGASGLALLLEIARELVAVL